MRYINKLVTLIMVPFLLVSILLSNGKASEIDDSTVFVEAFNAYQQKDYLLAIEKCNQLNQVFPNSPLRDVSLLLVARASLKSGDNLRAAKSIVLFENEFPASSLKTSVEEELKSLADRPQKGEVLSANKTLQTAARKTSTDRIAREQAAKLKLEMERVAKLKAERERLARVKLEEEKREKERLIAEKLAKASIKVAIALRDGKSPVPVGNNATLPIEISNKGKNSEELILNVSAAKEYGAKITRDDKSDESISRIQLAAGETFIGTVRFKMPTEMVDGHRSTMNIDAVSAKFSDIRFQKDTVIVSSAPLIRAVAKLAKPRVSPGEVLRYRVAVLNAGSLPAEDLSVRLQLPSQVVFQSAQGVLPKQEPNGLLVFKLDKVDIGQLVEISLNVKVLENCEAGQELRGQVEVVNGTLQRKDIFSAGASVVALHK